MSLLRRTFTTLLVAGWAAVVLGDARDLYREGMEALEAGRWVDAAARFEAAIRERPEPKARSFLGREYLPYHRLGMARAGADDCPGALAAFVEAEKYGEVRQVEAAWRELLATRSRCEERLEAFGSELGELEARFEAASGLAREVDDLAATEPVQAFWTEGDRPFSERRGWVDELLAQARASRDDAVRAHREERLVDADRLLGEATTELEQLRADVRARLTAQAERLQEDVRESVDQLADGARRLIGSVEALAPYPRQLGRRVELVRSLLRQIDEQGRGADVGRLEQLRQDLRSAVGALRAASKPPPEPLIRLGDAFLGGRYSEILEPDPEADSSWRNDPRAAAFACWLEAAALHARLALGGSFPPGAEIPVASGAGADIEAPAPGAGPSEVGVAVPDGDLSADGEAGEDPPSLREKIRACQAFDVEVVLPAAYVSPTFLELWSDVAAESAAAEGGGAADG